MASEQKIATDAQEAQSALNKKLYMNVVDQGSGGFTMDMVRFKDDDVPGVVYYKTHSENQLGYELLKTITCDDDSSNQ